MKKSVLLLSILTTACVTHSGVIPVGKDTYAISVATSGLISSQDDSVRGKKEAVIQASQYCESLNKELLVENIKSSASPSGSTNDMVFQCLNSDDPELGIKPDFKTRRDIFIENRM
jgi:predicted small secreted protein